MSQAIVIDVGHGWVVRGGRALYDPGAVAGSWHEYHIAALYATSLRFMLRQHAPDWQVYLINCANESQAMSLTARARYHADAPLVSIHLNAHQTTEAHGYEVLYRKPESQAFAQVLLDATARAFPERRNRGLKQANLAVLARKAPCALVELGFMTNAEELSYLLLRETRVRWAQQVSSALIDYLGGGR